MSGSGGYYKYRCKYWLTYDCPNWVWVNNSPCAHCLAEGRESDEIAFIGSSHISKEIYVPQVENGTLCYTIMEIVAGGPTGIAWALKPKPVEAPERVDRVVTTEPSAVTMTASSGLEVHNQ